MIWRMCKECQKYYILAIKNINVDKCDLEKMLDFATSTFSVWKADYQAVPLSKPWSDTVYEIPRT